MIQITSWAPAVLFCIQCVLFSVFPLSHGIWLIDMIPSSSQLRAHIPPSPEIELEAISGSLEDYDDRSGYLPDFLGDSDDLAVPLPLPKDKSDLVQVERAPTEKPFELRYQNFSVIMSRSRRFCCITGVNIDGSSPFFRFKRPGWKIDPRIPKAAQVGGADFMSPPFSIADIWFADSIPCGGSKAPLAWPTPIPITTPIPAPRCIRLMTQHGATSKTGFFRRSAAGTARGRSLQVQFFKSPIPCIKE